MERIFLAWIVSALFALRLAELLLFNARKQKGQVRFSWTTTALILSGSAVYAGSAAELLLWNFELLWPLTAVGGALCALRLALKVWAVRTLGRAWSAFIEVRDRQPLVREGPYRFVRHPVYLSALFEVLCIPMIAHAPVSAAYALLVHWTLIFLRTRAEEATLRAQFGEEYAAYAREVPALIPRFRSRIPAASG
jgi:protein-S-isoprenylcysteine O-methyltransferase Ste14